MTTVERQLQTSLDKLKLWCDQSGFNFSKTKTVCVHFCQKRGLHLDPSLALNGMHIPVVDKAKILGVYFDRKLSFISHFRYLRAKCQKSLNLLKVIAKQDWGGDRTVLLQLYRSLVRSKLDYGSIIWGSARKSYLQMLDPIANQGLRLALGVFRTSPIESLQAEANEPSLYLRREKLALQYALRVSQNPKNPTFKSIFEPNFQHLFEKRPKSIPPLSLRIKPFMEKIQFNTREIQPITYPKVPPWKLAPPQIIFDIAKDKKGSTSPDIYKSNFNEIVDHLKGYTHVFTDGSKSNDGVAAAAVIGNLSLTSCLSKYASIFTAEIVAISLALSAIEEHYNDRFVIFYDSKSALQSLLCFSPKNPLILELIQFFNRLSRRNHIVCCWLPSHIGIEGNERADYEAKRALTLRHKTNSLLPASDIKCLVQPHIKEKWQDQWSSLGENKLREIKKSVTDVYRPSCSGRREEVVLTRLRIGHSHLTHSYLLKREDRPECVGCASPFTVRHVLVECANIAHIRVRYFEATTMHELFTKVPSRAIIDFVKELEIFRKI